LVGISSKIKLLNLTPPKVIKNRHYKE